MKDVVIHTKVQLYGDPPFALAYLKSPKTHLKESKSKKSHERNYIVDQRWIALDIMQFRPDPRDDMWIGSEYNADVERDSKGVKYVTVRGTRYKVVR